MLLAIFTYNRPDYLQNLINSLTTSICDEVVIFNDNLDTIICDYQVFNENRKGIHYQKNKALKYFENSKHSIMFMCEDDVFFKSSGWEKIYSNDQRQMISYFNPLWGGNRHNGNPYTSQGAFCKITKAVINKIGYFDVKNMGFRGIGHLDYAVRYCKAFNQPDYFDVPKSNDYIGMILKDYRHSLPQKEIDYHRSQQATKIKIAKDRVEYYVPFSR
jgi:glycosyltransferase involved in cell wall biosynthesis